MYTVIGKFTSLFDFLLGGFLSCHRGNQDHEAPDLGWISLFNPFRLSYIARQPCNVQRNMDRFGIDCPHHLD